MRSRSAARSLAVLPVIAVCVLALLGGCEASTVRSLGWEIDFETDALRSRAVFVEGRILEGGCTSSSVRYASEVSRGSMPEPAPRLETGRYGFEARARDAECVWFAAECVEVDVPQQSGDVVRITLVGAAEMPACAPAMCAEGRCGGVVDAGMDDAGMDDAGPPDAGGDSGACTGDAQCGECMRCTAG
ncbi:MAG: hypothetical protein M3Y87_24350, partial [Myxococcota bacterium]|nr:hypothetical protein [Myxococcota bacterium]